MPQAVEVAFYQLGMRFTHCECLHGECTTLITGRGGPHRVALLRHCLRALGRAMDDITGIANLDEALADMGQALIREFEQLWNAWASLSTWQLQSDEMNYEPFNENASRFDDFMSNQVLPRVRSPSLDCDKWYELGREVSHVYWSNPNWGRGLPDWKPLEENLTARWRWGNESRVNELLRALQMSEDALAPPITECEGDSGLPFNARRDGDQYWCRLEKGLEHLKSEHQIAFAPPRPAPQETAAAPEMPEHDSRRRAIEVDVAQCRVRVENTWHTVRSNQADMMQLLVAADGEKISLASRGFRARDVDNLPTELAELVKREPGKGTWIPREKLWSAGEMQ